MLTTFLRLVTSLLVNNREKIRSVLTCTQIFQFLFYLAFRYVQGATLLGQILPYLSIFISRDFGKEMFKNLNFTLFLYPHGIRFPLMLVISKKHN